MDPITSMNLVLCVVIVALAIADYSKKKNAVALYIDTAFGLFGLSHFITLLGHAESLTTVLVVVRTLSVLDSHLRIAEIVETLNIQTTSRAFT